LVVELCRLDTTPNSVVDKMRAAEDGCFRILERELGALAFPGAQLEPRPISPAIQNHANYSLLHSTKTPERPGGLSPEETYANRANLLFRVPGRKAVSRGQSIALNAHIDVVAPCLPPRVSGGFVCGRGACDDKGPAVSMVAALKVLSEALSEAGMEWNQDVGLHPRQSSPAPDRPAGLPGASP
jgi:acetylornithine deacetylase/succinyl-diaminopimelate desuccinylase-like protein